MPERRAANVRVSINPTSFGRMQRNAYRQAGARERRGGGISRTRGQNPQASPGAAFKRAQAERMTHGRTLSASERRWEQAVAQRDAQTYAAADAEVYARMSDLPDDQQTRARRLKKAGRARGRILRQSDRYEKKHGKDSPRAQRLHQRDALRDYRRFG